MKKIAIAGIALLAMFVFIGGNCGGGPVLEAPKITRVELTATTVKLFWQPIADATTEDFKEYVVYASKDSTYYDMAGDNDSLADFEVGIATDTATTVTLAAGDIWYVQVRSRNSNDEIGDYNLDLPFVSCSPRATGKALQVYGQVAGVASRCLFPFSTGTAIDTTSADKNKADFFLDGYVIGGTGFVLQITPPWARTAWRSWARKTGMKEITTTATTIDEQILIDDTGWSPGDSLGVRATKGKFYAFKCQDSTFAKIKVDSVFKDSVAVQNSFIRFDFAWQDNKNFRYLAPGK